MPAIFKLIAGMARSYGYISLFRVAIYHVRQLRNAAITGAVSGRTPRHM